MKNTFGFLFIILLLSSCAVANYSTQKGKINVAKAAVYTVKYQVNIGENATAKISYRDAEEVITLKEIKGQWLTTVSLKAGTKVLLAVDTEGAKTKGEFKVWVNDQIAAEYILTGKRLHYKLNFELP